MPLRLVIADDHLLVREGVQRLLEADPDFEVAAVCGDLDSLLAAVEAEHPDVVVTDIRMPPDNTDEGIRAAERLRTTDPDIGVVVLSQYATPSYALALLEAAVRAVPTSSKSASRNRVSSCRRSGPSRPAAR
jgi:DNA-binding NarL/FixJ family response regulator